jgi:Ycf66 protein N-terminus
MLAYILAVFIGTGSVGLYLSAFFFPEIHRKQDFIWSGVGCFYALFLWLYAYQVTGGILVGQTSSVALIGWLAWQTLKLRRQLVSSSQQSPIQNITKPQKQSSIDRASIPKVTKPPAKTPAPASIQPPSIPQSRGSADEQTAPVASIPLSQVKIPPASSKEDAPVDKKVSSDVRKTPSLPNPVNEKENEKEAVSISGLAPTALKTPQPVSPNVATEDDEAWIKLEVKPVPATSKPLGTPVQPPILMPSASNAEISQPQKSVPTSEATTIVPSESLSAITKLDDEERQ